MRNFWIAQALTALLVIATRCTPARADELPADGPPCHDEPPNVVCHKPSFDKLVGRLVAADKGHKLCLIDLKAMTDERDELQRRLDEVIVVPSPAPPREPSAPAPALGYTLYAVGILAATLVPALTALPVEVRVIGGATGAVLTGFGVMLALPR